MISPVPTFRHSVVRGLTRSRTRRIARRAVGSADVEPMEITAGTLHLRPWSLSDADAEVAALALRDPEIRRWAIGPLDRSDEPDERAWLAQRADGWADGSSVSFAVADATTGEVLGHIRVRIAAGSGE